MKKLIFIIMAFAITGFVQAQDANKATHAFSLDQCVEYAQKNNVQVKNALLAIEVQAQTNREIAATALPTINTNLSGTNFWRRTWNLYPSAVWYKI